MVLERSIRLQQLPMQPSFLPDMQLMEYCGSITTNGHPPRIISLTTNGFPVIPDYMRQEQTSMQELQLQRWNVSNRQESVLMINPT